MKPVNYTDDDYKWVKEQINLSYPPGTSPRDLIVIAKDWSKNPDVGPLREENPPKKYKIMQIVKDGHRIDWDYQESSGGKHKKSVLIPITPDSKIYTEKMANIVSYSEIVSRLRVLHKKKNIKFLLDDAVELAKIKNDLMMFPMSVYYGKKETGLKRDILFKSVVGLVRNQIEIIKKIQKAQRKINENFPEILESIDALFRLEIDQRIIATVIKNRSKAKLVRDKFKITEISPLRNTINRLMK